MKTIFSSLVLSLFFIAGSAQQSIKQSKAANQETIFNYGVLTKNVQQLKPILLAAEALAKEDGKAFGNFEIIVCGKNIGDLTDLKSMEPFMKEAERLGASIIACGFSLKKFKVTGELPKGVKKVDNGILYNLQLQKKGYLSLEL